jgi:hypothetical protein
MKRISNTKASRTAAEREEYDRINAHLDQALELTFPCSDPVAITINGYDVFRREAAIDFAGKREPVTVLIALALIFARIFSVPSLS